MAIVVRKSADRGHANHGWLNSYHTFSFAGYQDSKMMGFHKLRVINEDRVAPSEGFGKHPHAEMEIFSYVVSGALEHKDSMGNSELIKRGDVQFTSAGTGIYHSEYNGSNSELVHFLQIWVKPAVTGIKPSYQTSHYSDEQKLNKLCLIISPEATDGSVRINQDIKMFASILHKDQQVSYTIPQGRAGYIHVVDTKGSIKVNDVALESGDGAFVHDAHSLTITGNADQSEFLLFDLAKTD